MSLSHDKCPICNRELQHSKYFNHPCMAAGGKNLSYLDSVCNNVKDFQKPPEGYPIHTFFQVTSLYGDCLEEAVLFPDTGVDVSVNYIKQVSTITYFARYNYTDTAYKEPMKIVWEGRVLEFDYPKLEKLINKVRTLAPFL